VQVISGTNTTNYLWDEQSAYGDVLIEADNSWNVQTSYTLGNGEIIGQNRSSTLNYYLMDGHSGVRGLTNSSGSLTDSYAYGAFGDLKNSTGTTANNYRYTGQQFDNLTGLYSLRARYYNPSEGRFLSRDTWQIDQQNPDEYNRYAYVANNPINAFDPSGNQESFLTLLIPLATKTAKGYLVQIVTTYITSLIITMSLIGADDSRCFMVGESYQQCEFLLTNAQTDQFGKLLGLLAAFSGFFSTTFGIISGIAFRREIFKNIGYAFAAYSLLFAYDALKLVFWAFLIGNIASSGGRIVVITRTGFFVPSFDWKEGKKL
jgi:RHS repeat-associated protein